MLIADNVTYHDQTRLFAKWIDDFEAHKDPTVAYIIAQ
jgi:hypothetical protein